MVRHCARHWARVSWEGAVILIISLFPSPRCSENLSAFLEATQLAGKSVPHPMMHGSPRCKGPGKEQDGVHVGSTEGLPQGSPCPEAAHLPGDMLSPSPSQLSFDAQGLGTCTS